jgi:hypothetical protein
MSAVYPVIAQAHRSGTPIGPVDIYNQMLVNTWSDRDLGQMKVWFKTFLESPGCDEFQRPAYQPIYKTTWNRWVEVLEKLLTLIPSNDETSMIDPNSLVLNLQFEKQKPSYYCFRVSLHNSLWIPKVVPENFPRNRLIRSILLSDKTTRIIPWFNQKIVDGHFVPADLLPSTKLDSFWNNRYPPIDPGFILKHKPVFGEHIPADERIRVLDFIIENHAKVFDIRSFPTSFKSIKDANSKTNLEDLVSYVSYMIGKRFVDLELYRYLVLAVINPYEFQPDQELLKFKRRHSVYNLDYMNPEVIRDAYYGYVLTPQSNNARPKIIPEDQVSQRIILRMPWEQYRGIIAAHRWRLVALESAIVATIPEQQPVENQSIRATPGKRPREPEPSDDNSRAMDNEPLIATAVTGPSGTQRVHNRLVNPGMSPEMQGRFHTQLISLSRIPEPIYWDMKDLIKKGIVLDKLFESIIVDAVNPDDILLGDKNAIVLATRL